MPEGIEIKTPTGPGPKIGHHRASTSSRSARSLAEIREWRKPEPYKGKGVRYLPAKYIFRKEGKKK